MEKSPYTFNELTDEPTVSPATVVKGGLNTKKLVLIVGSIIAVGVIAAVGVGVGVAALNKDDGSNDGGGGGTTPSPQRDPIDGEWTYWDKWSDCSVTCGGGTQVRRRTCNAPPPLFGGKVCSGKDFQTRECSKWNCPDCGKVCPAGGTLSKDCDVCLCQHDVLFGTVRDSNNMPLHGVDVYFAYKEWEPVATTNYWGEYRVQNLCASATKLLFKKQGFMQNETLPVSVNATSHKANGVLRKYEKPRITKMPLNKYRFVGMSATLCCEAEGFPSKMTYSWLKNGVQVATGLSRGMLSFPNLSKSDQAQYTCVAESTAGIVKSETVEITVKDISKDTCPHNPVPKKESLPTGCFALVNGAKETEVDIGQCEQLPCIKSTDIDNGTCEEWWPSKCCNVETVDRIEVTCPDFSYSINKIKACGCRVGEAVSMVTGIAFGFRNGSQVPFARGKVYVDGGETKYTSSGGMFTFTVPFEKTRVTLLFQEDIHHEFFDAIKPLAITPGSTMVIKVVLQLRPRPSTFNTRIGMSIPINNLDGAVPISTVSIPQDALLDEDGNKFEGEANLFVGVMDPRKIEDLQSSDGEFSSADEQGDPVPLETFGMFQFQFEDKAGKGLFLSGPITTQMDGSLFNISNDKDGNPDLSLWHLDPNTGSWVEEGKFKYIQSPARRKLLATTIEGSIDPSNLPDLKLTYTKVTTKLVRKVNYDRRTYNYYTTVIDRDPNAVKDGACYVRVRVYSDLKLSNPSNGVTVRAVTKELSGPRFKGKSDTTTNSDGIACVRIFCNSKVFLYIPDQPQMYATDTHNLPNTYMFKNIHNLTQVEFISVDPYLGEQRNSGETYSPVYDYRQSPACSSSTSKGYFQFAPIQKGHRLQSTPLVPIDKHNNRQSWYPRPVSDPLHKSCFIKLNINSNIDSFDIISMSSSQNSSSKSDMYGTYFTSPYWDESTDNRYSKAACIEFRCPGLVVDGTTRTQNVPTWLSIFISSDEGARCTIDSRTVPINQTGRGNVFRFLADPADKYGEQFGVFVRNKPSDDVRRMCESGTTSGAVSTTMKPDKNPALKLTCK